MIREQLVYGLGRLAALARQKDWQIGEGAGLTPTQADVLRLLAERPAGLRLKDLAAQLSVRSSTASDAVSALAGKQLVDRRPDPDHGRAIRVCLSRDGRVLLGQIPDGFGDIVGLLSDENAKDLHTIVVQTIAQLQRAGRIAPQRMCLTCRYFVSDTNPADVGEHYCQLMKAPLRRADLRLNCPEHEEASPST